MERLIFQGFLEMLTGENADLWCEALRRDLGKPRQEAMTMEVEYTANCVRTALRNLDSWMRDEHTEKSTLTLLVMKLFYGKYFLSFKKTFFVENTVFILHFL